MSTATSMKNQQASAVDSKVLARVIQEGYGPSAWHGPDLKAALTDVSPKLAFWRPASGRHNIAEIALHHAYFVRAVISQLSGEAPKPFVLEGEDWFELTDAKRLTWPRILEAIESQQKALAGTVEKIVAGRLRPPAGDLAPLDLVLGITCHAIYHAGQIQLIRRLAEAK
jgi:uncharacterized damage-inducible protein DinB